MKDFFTILPFVFAAVDYYTFKYGWNKLQNILGDKITG